MKALVIALCLLSVSIVAVPTASALECMDYYRETHVGPVIIVQRSSCQVEVCYETTANCGLLS